MSTTIQPTTTIAAGGSLVVEACRYLPGQNNALTIRSTTKDGFAAVYDFYDWNKRFLFSSTSLVGGTVTMAPRTGFPDYVKTWYNEGSNTAFPFSAVRFVIARGTSSVGTVSSVITRCYALLSPIAIDLDGDGTIGRVSGAVSFDLDGDGTLDALNEWFTSGDGILFDTRVVGPASGKSLMGDQGGLFSDGYEKLATFDANGDRSVSGAELTDLALWTDDGDAVLEPNEVVSLKSAGIEAISVDHLGYRSSATTADGTEVLTEDVWFEV